MSFANNEYYTFNRCGDFEADWKPKNEPTSTIGFFSTSAVFLPPPRVPEIPL